MKKIINGKRYNTETATHVANFNNGMGQSDFRWVDEDLYLTPKGNWFVHGAGGPMTRYARQTGSNCWSGSEDIHVLTSEEAREWLEEHGKTRAIERYFAVEDA